MATSHMQNPMLRLLIHFMFQLLNLKSCLSVLFHYFQLNSMSVFQKKIPKQSLTIEDFSIIFQSISDQCRPKYMITFLTKNWVWLPFCMILNVQTANNSYQPMLHRKIKQLKKRNKNIHGLFHVTNQTSELNSWLWEHSTFLLMLMMFVHAAFLFSG